MAIEKENKMTEAVESRPVNPRGITWAKLDADRVNWALGNWQHAQSLLVRPESLDLPVCTQPIPLGETLWDSSVDVEGEAIANADFELLLSGLNERQQMVLRMRFGQDLYISEIARIMKLDISTVRHHEQNGLDKIRKKFGLPTEIKVYDSRTPQEKRDYQKHWHHVRNNRVHENCGRCT